MFLVWLIVSSASSSAQEVRVEDLEFKGNKKLSSGKLAKAIHTQANPWYRLFMRWIDSRIFDEEVFLTDLLRIERFYQQEGYLQARVKDYDLKFNKKGDEVNIVVHIEEGEATKVNEVQFVFKSDSSRRLTPERLQKQVKLKPGKRYREEDLKLDYEKIVERFANNGYPYIDARVRPTVDLQRHLVDLEWVLQPGPFCRFGEIRYSGNHHVSAGSIRRGLGLSTGDPFQQKKLINAQSQVYRLELFQFVSLQATNLENQPSRIPIEVKVREARLRTLKLGLGFGSEEKFRGFGQWRHRNFLGGARILRIGAKHSTRLLPLELELELSQPYFLSNRNDLIVKPFFIWEEENSFQARRIGAETTLNRRLTSKTNGFFTTLVERDTVEVRGQGVAPQASGEYKKSILRFGFRHDSSDQLFTPTRGRVSIGFIEESGRLLNTPFKYIKLYTEHRFYEQSKNKKYVVAAKIAFGAMKRIRGSKDTPIAERFFAGGNYSVRGWGRQLLGPLEPDSTGTPLPRGGNSMLEGSIEYRRPLFKQFTGALFLDYGNVWPEWDGFDVFDLRYAIGAGLRYNTLIGPVRIDFAWKVNKQELDERDYEIHLSIGQAF
ncbi:MAG: outer membrane protein assembly factor BamA [bacterium]